MIQWMLGHLGRGKGRSPEEAQRLRRRADVVRDFWLILATGLMVLALVHSQQAVTRSQNALQAQVEGRRIGQLITCASISAVIDAGRATITGSNQIGPPRFERSLEALGLPRREVREQQAQTGARLYAQSIARKVETASGVRGIVKKDGSLNCALLRRLTAIR